MQSRLIPLFAVVGLVLFTSEGSKAVEADNSSNNSADRSHDAITPESQSNEYKDLETTRAIRRALVKDSSLSVYAHNIKIITAKDHVVYLRGTISSSDDISKIVSLAQKSSGGHKVMNQLSVTSK